MQLDIKSNVKTSVTTYIHVKPIFSQALMIWLEISDHHQSFDQEKCLVTRKPSSVNCKGQGQKKIKV